MNERLYVCVAIVIAPAAACDAKHVASHGRHARLALHVLPLADCAAVTVATWPPSGWGSAVTTSPPSAKATMRCGAVLVLLMYSGAVVLPDDGDDAGRAAVYATQRCVGGDDSDRI